MARTINWPPTPVNGRLSMVEGPDASSIMVMQVLGDLSQNPFNPDDISMGDITFRSKTLGTARIEVALARLQPIISVDSVTEEDLNNGSIEYVINFTDRESRAQRSVTHYG